MAAITLFQGLFGAIQSASHLATHAQPDANYAQNKPTVFAFLCVWGGVLCLGWVLALVTRLVAFCKADCRLCTLDSWFWCRRGCLVDLAESDEQESKQDAGGCHALVPANCKLIRMCILCI